MTNVTLKILILPSKNFKFFIGMTHLFAKLKVTQGNIQGYKKLLNPLFESFRKLIQAKIVVLSNELRLPKGWDLADLERKGI